MPLLLSLLSISLKLRFLKFWLPFIEDGAFYRAYRQASAAVYAGSIINVSVLSIFGVCFALGPVNAFDRTNGNAISNSFAEISDYGVGH
jgi:uncharacterized membrane protein